MKFVQFNQCNTDNIEKEYFTRGGIKICSEYLQNDIYVDFY